MERGSSVVMKGQAGESYKGLADPFLQERAQELCESRGGCPGLPVPNSPHGLYGRKETFNEPKDGTWVERGYEGSSRGKL